MEAPIARDGSGTYDRTQADYVSGTTIESAKINSELNDMGAALTQSLSKDGQTTPTASLPMGGFKLTGLGAGTGNGESVRYEQLTTTNTNLFSIKHIGGLTYSNNSGDATNDIDIAAGSCVDSTGAYWMTLSATLVKRLDAAWAVGTNQGGLDTGSIADTDYFIWLIARSDTGVVDALFSTSATAPTMPANYDYKRLIGWFRRASSAIVLFLTYEVAGGGLEYTWRSKSTDFTLTNTLTNTPRDDVIAVPVGLSVMARLMVAIADAAVGSTLYVSCPDDTNDSTTTAGGQLATQVAGVAIRAEVQVRTDTSAQITSIASLATMDTYSCRTIGFIWSRR